VSSGAMGAMSSTAIKVSKRVAAGEPEDVRVGFERELGSFSGPFLLLLR
jgi:hypothetical protein